MGRISYYEQLAILTSRRSYTTQIRQNRTHLQKYINDVFGKNWRRGEFPCFNHCYVSHSNIIFCYGKDALDVA